MSNRIRLRGISGDLEGKIWEAEGQLRVGRLASLEIVLDDTSVSRKHAEVRFMEGGWRVRDLGSTNGTFVNGVKLQANDDVPIKARDIVQFGKIALSVESVGDLPSSEQLLVEASTRSSWEEAMNTLAFDQNRCPRPGEQLLALLRAGHHLVHAEDDEQLNHAILNDAVAVLDAQRGAIVLADGPNGKLQLRALATNRRSEPPGRFSFSQNLAFRTFSSGESVLCSSVSDDPDLATAQSIADGAMASVLCVLLRTPRRRLGVLHLDRSYWQKPFTKDDLHLADALAANVSAGIECAQLFKKQRELFYHTLNILAQAVELRDPYTGGHTQRVTNFSILLAEELKLSNNDRNLIRIGTPLHDIGKIGIDDSILRKPGRLTPEEFVIMQSHTDKGAKILETVPDLAPVIPIARSHHERWDGKGYPQQLAGEGIPLLARIVAVADAFDAMTSTRPYRKGLAPDIAFAEVEKEMGQQFDPDCARAFLALRERVIDEMSGRKPTMMLTANTP